MNEKIVLNEEITIGDKYGPAMEITDEDEAKIYFEACVEHMMERGNTREEAIKIEKSNIGYYAGYYDNKTAARVYQLFKCSHPVFGGADNWPTPEKAFEMGKELASE